VTEPIEPRPDQAPPDQAPPPRPPKDDGLPWMRTLLLTVIVGAVMVAGFGIWYIFFRPAGPPPVSGPPVIPGSSASVQATPTPGATGAGTAVPAGSLDGTWSVDPSIGSFDYAAGDFSGSWVGYRVQEELAGVGGSTAVGRTPDVTGSLTLQDTTVTDASFQADLTTLQSDERLRDSQLARQGVQTDQFPTAAFKLTRPIELGSLPENGQDLSVDAAGDLTIHGVTKSVTIPLHAALRDGVIAVAGSLTFSWGDFGMEQPTAARVVSLADDVTMETQLFFSKKG
jgi:polyisoprenoid-binding protein YceI